MKTLKSVSVFMSVVCLAFTACLPNAGAEDISISQAISDEAQANTIAFDAMAFLSGNLMPVGSDSTARTANELCSNTFLPPGKVADFSGFQYLRDTDPSQLGHNTSFVTIIAYNIWNILNTDQRAIMTTLAANQISQIRSYGYGRLPLVKAFVRLLTGDIPSGSSGLVKSKVMAYSAALYALDGQISYDRAVTLGSILRGMSADQKAQLDALKASGIKNWVVPTDAQWKALSISVEVSTYASEMYSWYAGGVEPDTYFCPERQATYFGSFYMKDMPAMVSSTPVTISSSLTADVGTDFLNVLTSTQKALITGLTDIQRNDLYEIVSTRRLISTQLRRFMTESSVDSATVLALAKRYGELDGEIVYNYANNFVNVGKTMTDAQKSQLLPILSKYSWDRIACSGAYLYSEKLSAMPDIDPYGQNILSSCTSNDYFFTTTSGGSGLAGDVNGDGNVNLTDAILALHILSGIPVTETINQNADVNGDKKIGIEELLYILQTVSVMRSSSATSSSFTLTSDAGSDGGTLPVEYSCDGAGASIALSWANAPAGTKEFALMMTTIPVDGSTKWNWVLYGIPATANGLAKNSSGVGTLGLTSDGPNLAYYPPCPQGPGTKLYTFTVYALSASPTLPAANQVTGAVLTNAISSIMLGSASLSLSYTR